VRIKIDLVIELAELKFGIEKSTYPEKNRPLVNVLINSFKSIAIYGA
jgi:hypothetical protein